MNVEEAVNQGYKYFRKDTTFGPSYLELVETITVVKVKNLVTGNTINLEGDYSITPVKEKPSEQKMDKENSYRKSKSSSKKSSAKSGPSLNDILLAEIGKIKSKDDLKKILKANGIEIGPNTIRYAWFKRNQIIKKGGSK